MAIITNQRMVWARQGSSVTVPSNATKGVWGATFWAWIASIAVHLVVLTAFGFVEFSQSETQGEQRPRPMAKVSRVEKLIRAAPIIPKPKIKKPTESRFANRTNRLSSTNQIFDVEKSGSQNWPIFTNPSASQDVSLLSSANLPKGIGLFGSFTDQRKICYLVDCSGSMQGILGRVRKKLKDSIESLQPDQYFYIIFFGGDRLFEFGDGKLLRATEQTKSAAYNFIESVRPAGQTNELAALERAMQIRDASGFSPSIVYFLTDGFELTTEDVQKFSQRIANLLERFAPTTKINTIGFWPQSEDRKMLETIARQSGGEVVFIDDL